MQKLREEELLARCLHRMTSGRASHCLLRLLAAYRMISSMAANPEASPILSFEAARHRVEEQAAQLHPRGKELLSLLDACGRILGEAIIADRNFPPFPRSARDGYAVRAADLEPLPSTLAIVGEIKAGAAPEQVPDVGVGQAAAIMTGAPAPAGSDAVVMLESTMRQGDRVQISKAVAAGENIVAPGAEAKRGEPLLTPGVRLDSAAIALAASVGKSHLLVYAKPQVAVLATGDEVVDIDVRPGPNQIRNSNSYSLAAQIQAAGAEPVLLPIAPDEPARLEELIGDGLESDLLVLSGGVSAGKYDLVEQVLAVLAAEFFFTGAQIQPGRPIVFGRIPRPSGTQVGLESSTRKQAMNDAGQTQDHTYFFGLPGNPVSTMVTFDLFVRPLLDALAGLSPRSLVFLHAKLTSEIRTKAGLKRFLPGLLSGEFEHTEVDLVRWQGSGDIAATARSNCYLVIPPDRTHIAAGEWVPVLLRN
jgi:molybdopterin molybdotransferase